MKKKGVFLFQQSLVIIISLLLLGASVATFGQLRNIKTSQLKTECRVLDRALESWAAAHMNIKDGTVVFTQEGPMYEKIRTYPLTKTDLMELQTRGVFTNTVDLAKYRYETKNNGADYKLEVYLPDSTLYKSPRSTY